jgi:hypothetical protein
VKWSGTAMKLCSMATKSDMVALLEAGIVLFCPPVGSL